LSKEATADDGGGHTIGTAQPLSRAEVQLGVEGSSFVDFFLASRCLTEVGLVLISYKGHVSIEVVGRPLQGFRDLLPWLECLSCGCHQDELGHVLHVLERRRLRQVQLVDSKYLAVVLGDEMLVRLAQQIHEGEDESLVLAGEPLQIIEEAFDQSHEQADVLDSGLTEELVDSLPQGEIVLLQVEEHGFNFVFFQRLNLVEASDALEGSNSDFINFIIKHVDQEAQNLGPDRRAPLPEDAHDLDTSQAYSHGVIFQEEQQDALDVLLQLLVDLRR